MRKQKTLKPLLGSNAGVATRKENIVSGNLGITLHYSPKIRNTRHAEWEGGKDDILNDSMGDDKPNQKYRRRQYAGKRRHARYDIGRMHVKNMSAARQFQFVQASGARLASVCSRSTECPTF